MTLPREANSLPRETVQKIANLSRLQLTDAEIDAIGHQLGQILEYVALLDEVDVSQVEPMVHAIELTNVTRADIVQPSLPRSEALQAAPKHDQKHFLVPAIIES